MKDWLDWHLRWNAWPWSYLGNAMAWAGEQLACWLLRICCRRRDRWLSRRLHQIADRYDTRPTGEWDETRDDK